MALSTSANFIKYLLFLFNFFFVITGVIIMSVGLTVQGAYHGFRDILDAKFFSIPTFLVVIGSFIFVIAFFGCCGAYKENYCMTLTFSILLILIFILELAAGISGYVLRNDTRELVTNALNGSMTQYGDPKHGDITLIWDEIQVDFDCCGVENSTDWARANPTMFNETYIPMTCCRPQTGAVGMVSCPDAEGKTLRKIGCVHSFGDFVKAHAVSLGAAGIALAVIQFFGIMFACYLAKQIKLQRLGVTSY
ncbi:CD63 antigen-like [Anopheles albimanus]|uniref:Tetraspanin n=1 Tax=Anopheles albimanus TaxID=7167 RepID=A0A182F4D2_ANOAL|nr:CD63 antigen-like [Anopheles albimanus]XP_035772699.1 CD63 antigen-like [Anopheles albimanus]